MATRVGNSVSLFACKLLLCPSFIALPLIFKKNSDLPSIFKKQSYSLCFLKDHTFWM
eukprot:c5718_g1_i1 orf=249-419(+)